MSSQLLAVYGTQEWASSKNETKHNNNKHTAWALTFRSMEYRYGQHSHE